MSGRLVALWCALLLTAGTVSAYTVDCNHEYTDCDTELSKIGEDDEIPAARIAPEIPTTTSTTTSQTPLTITEKPTTNPPYTSTTDGQFTVAVEEVKPQPRLLNLNMHDLQNFAMTLHNETSKSGKKLTDLSDVTLDDDEEEPPRHVTQQQNNQDKFYSNLQAPFHALMSGKSESSEIEMCRENDIGYKIGEKIDRGCEETCECTAGGVFECSPRCKHPYIRRGRRLNDPLCFESPVDGCCSIIACATGNGDAKLTKLEVCNYNNKTYPVGSRWYIGCETSCECEQNSVVTCKPRCKRLPPSDKCINVQDPNDACCEVQVCDVSQDVHELTADNVTTTTTAAPHRFAEDLEEEKVNKRPLVLAEPIGSIKVLQNNTVQVNLMHLNNSEDPIHLLLSDDGGRTFQNIDLKYSNLILNLKGGKDYILKTKETGTKFNFTITASDNGPAEVNEVEEHYNISKSGCWEDGKFYEIGDEFRIGCTELCECTGPDTRECVALVCPNHVGLEIMSKGCVKWAPSPPAHPPNCCPRSARCLSDGTCHYNGVPVPNWSEVPISLTGCEQRCFCENGDLDCQEVCTPLPPVPPQNLRCPPMHRPAAVNISDEDCCKQWDCIPISKNPSLPSDFPPHKPQNPSFLPTLPPPEYPSEDIPDYDQNNIHHPAIPEQPNLPGLPPGIPNLPPGIQVPTTFGDMNKKLSVISIESDSTTSIKMLLGLPPVLVGLRGSVDLRYTDKADEDVSHWYSQVFAPADEVLTTPRLEFRLTGLKPGTTYKVRGKLFLHNLPVSPESDTYSVRTLEPPKVGPAEVKLREINSGLTVVDVNDTTAHVSWRHFNEDELQFIDGIQVRYRPVGTPIYSMTELLHHSRLAAELHDLRPGSRYEASMVLVPPPRATTELRDPTRVEFTTAPYIDPYNWTVVIEVRSVGAEAAELTWRGVPSPAERWVRVYRAAHACGDQAAGKEHDEFRLAARDQPPSVTLSGLEPDTRCRVWLELFLTNGKVKTSNVLEINTKSLDTDNPIDNEIEASGQSGNARGRPRGDYYTALVGVGVVAALGALTSFLLLLVVVRRHRPHSVPITPVPTAPRESSLPPYDNPAYKLELQQETMDL